MRIALVVGAAGDVGQGIAGALLAAGWRVIAGGRDAARLDALADRLGRPAALATVPGSVAEEDAAARFVAAVRSAAPALDAVIVSVNGPRRVAPLRALPAAELRRILAENLVTHHIAGQALLPAIAPGGTYLAIGGGMADHVVPGFGAVAACQAAQRQMLRVLAEENKAMSVRIRELIIVSMVNGESRRAVADPRWLTDAEIGRHVCAILDQPERFPGPILSLRSRRQVGEPEAA